jgi:hypothetical protein
MATTLTTTMDLSLHRLATTVVTADLAVDAATMVVLV